MSDKEKNYDAAFEHYRGRRRYTVAHPAHKKTLIVAAPDEVSAIVAAAKKWKERWQSVDFYAFCEVRVYNKKGADI